MPQSTAHAPKRRPPPLRRTWLLVAGADAGAQASALEAHPDVLVPDLEDFTPPPLRPRGREMVLGLVEKCHRRGVIAAVRVNPLASEGRNDLAVVMQARPDVVLLPKTAASEQIIELERVIADHERRLAIPTGSTEIVPMIESAAGLVMALAIARASKRVTACMLGGENMAADLGGERRPDASDLAYVRNRFLVECVAAAVVAVDMPYTFSDPDGARADTLQARRLGYHAKGVVAPSHVATVNDVLTPSAEGVERARRLVVAFEGARAAGRDRVEHEGTLVEVPTYLTAKRLIARAESLAEFTRPRHH